MSQKMEYRGTDVAEALKTACKQLKVSQEKLNIKVLATGTTGIFGLCRKMARIQVSLKDSGALPAKEKPRKTVREPLKGRKPTAEKTAGHPPDRGVESGKPSAPAKTGSEKPRPAADKRKTDPDKNARRKSKPAVAVKKEKPGSIRPRKDAGDRNKPAAIEIDSEIVTKIKDDLSRLLELMGCPSTVTIKHENNNVAAHISGDHIDNIVGPEGQTLDAMQYLFRKIISKNVPGKIIFSLDAGDFRATRMLKLQEMALSLADEVAKTGKNRSIPPINPAERRIVHVALQGHSAVRSRSVGDGIFKKILIYPQGKEKNKNLKNSGRQTTKPE